MTHNSVTLHFDRTAIGQPFNLDGIRVQLVRETQEAIYPYRHTRVSFIAEPVTEEGFTTTQWSTDLTFSERLYDAMRWAGLENEHIDALLELAHCVRMERARRWHTTTVTR